MYGWKDSCNAQLTRVLFRATRSRVTSSLRANLALWRTITWDGKLSRSQWNCREICIISQSEFTSVEEQWWAKILDSRQRVKCNLGMRAFGYNQYFYLSCKACQNRLKKSIFVNFNYNTKFRIFLSSHHFKMYGAL